jgi:hypothetical protein
MKKFFRFIFGRAWGRVVKSAPPPKSPPEVEAKEQPPPSLHGRRIIHPGVIRKEPAWWEKP